MSENIDMDDFFEAMAMHLLAVGTDDFDDKDFAGSRIGEQLMRLQVYTLKGEECFQVVGADNVELAEELVLACFHNISIEHLGALHLKPLNSPLQVPKQNENSV